MPKKSVVKKTLKSIVKKVNKGKKKLLFICNNNLVRSRTAEDVAKKNKNFEVKSAGLSPWADVPVSSQSIRWADEIFVMDEEHEFQKSRLMQKFPEALKKDIIILEIPSINVRRDDPELMERLREKLKPYLK